MDEPRQRRTRILKAERTRRCATAWIVRGWSVLLLFSLGASAAQADLVRLFSGGEIRGQILKQADDTSAGTLSIETVNGTVITLRRDRIDFVLERPLVVEEFEQRRQLTPTDVKALWNLAEWCREQRLTTQREDVLREILQLDPEHERAHYGLGHRKREGRWVNYDEYMREKGYVRHEGRWLIAQELEVIRQSEQELSAERNWYKKIRIWHLWLTGNDEGRRERALRFLQQTTDGHAVPALRQFLSDDENPLVRAVYLETLANIRGAEATEAMAISALMDSSEELRARALAGIDPASADKAVRAFVRELQNDSNVIVRRAAQALGQLGDIQVTPHLIDALITKHRYKVTVPGTGAPTFSVAADGSFPNASTAGYIPPQIEQMLRAGQLPNGVEINYVPHPGAANQTHTATVEREERNQEVLDALILLTGRDFGYDRKTWKHWWMASKVDLNWDQTTQ